MNQKFLENKIKMIPTTIKETYSDLDQKNPVLVSRELIADGHTMLGVEYVNNTPVRAYTTDETGKKIGITNLDEKNNYSDYALRDVISEHLQKISTLTENKKAKEEQKMPETVHKVRKTEVSKETANYINRHGKTKV